MKLNSCLLIFFVFFFCCTSVVISDDNGGERQEYIIGYGDQLLITIIGHENELTAPVIVRPDGMISYDIIGNVKAEGFTIAQLSSAIREKLFESGYYSDPRVSVQLKESRLDIYVIGDVMEPGTKRFLKPSSVIEVLASAGGYKESADLANAVIIRKNERIPVNLELIKTFPINKESTIAELSKDEYLLKSGDVLLIPSAIKERLINVIGHVHKPGAYPVKSDVSIIEALALAGGALEDTADLKHVAIVTNEGVKTLDATMAWNQTSSQNSGVRLQPGDSVIVPERGKISILGLVEKQGQITVDGEITIVEALALAGIKEGADLKKIRIVRSTGQEFTINVSKLWKQPGQYLNERLGAGDTVIVPAKPFSINWNAIYSTVMVFSTLYAVFKK
jgi:polysaccharide biosynthesis/export protein